MTFDDDIMSWLEGRVEIPTLLTKYTRALWMLTDDDAQDEPPDFPSNDGMDE